MIQYRTTTDSIVDMNENSASDINLTVRLAKSHTKNVSRPYARASRPASTSRQSATHMSLVIVVVVP